MPCLGRCRGFCCLCCTPRDPPHWQEATTVPLTPWLHLLPTHHLSPQKHCPLLSRARGWCPFPKAWISRWVLVLGPLPLRSATRERDQSGPHARTSCSVTGPGGAWLWVQGYWTFHPSQWEPKTWPRGKEISCPVHHAALTPLPSAVAWASHFPSPSLSFLIKAAWQEAGLGGQATALRSEVKAETGLGSAPGC